MPILIEDDHINALAERYKTMIHAESKLDAVRQALESVLGDKAVSREAWNKVGEIQKRLRELSPLATPLPHNEEFLEALYEVRK